MTTTPIETLYVSRTVPLASPEVTRALWRLPTTFGCNATSLVLGEEVQPRWHQRRSPPPYRRATLRFAPLPMMRFRVEVEVVPWSLRTTEIAIRPVGRRCRWWPRHYCEAAHTIIDHVVGLTIFQALRAGAPLPAPQHLRRAS